MNNWFYIAMAIICAVSFAFPALEKIFKDPVAQQIESCEKACGKQQMSRYEANTKTCECKEK